MADNTDYSEYLARIDPAGADYELAAIRPGLALFEEGGSDTYRVLAEWLGSFVAEPAWRQDPEGRSFLGYYLHNEAGDPVVAASISRRPLETKELSAKWVRRELSAQLARLESQAPKTAGPRKDIYNTVYPRLKELHERAHGRSGAAYAHQAGSYLLQYVDPATKKKRLAWCWAHERTDHFSARHYLCPVCLQLFPHRDRDRRAGQRAKCPSCGWQPAAGLQPRHALFAAAALLLLGLGIGTWWFLHQPRGGEETIAVVKPKTPEKKRVEPPPPPEKKPAATLAVKPDPWRGPMGAPVQFAVTYRGTDGAEQDVTSEAVFDYAEPQFARLTSDGVTGIALAPGRTVVQVAYRDGKTQTTVIVDPPVNPDEVRLEPGEAELGIGTTQRLSLIGKYKDGREANLSATSEWATSSAPTVFLYQGLVEGLAEGEAEIQARYRASPESDYVQATAKVRVKAEAYTGLEVVVDPAEVAAGRTAQLRVEAVTAAGRRQSVLESSRLRLRVEPPQVARVAGTAVQADTAGEAKLLAEFNDLSAAADLRVTAPPEEAKDVFQVRPERLDLTVGQAAPLVITSSRSDPIRIESSDPRIAEPLADHQVAARAAGDAVLTVSQGADQQVEVKVHVAAGEPAGVTLQPATVAVRVADAVPVVVRGRFAGPEGREVELAPDQVTWPQVPDPNYATFDPATRQVTGKAPTAEAPQQLTVRWGTFEATAPVQVLAPPFRLELEPAGPLEVPAGQQATLHAWADYAGDKRVEIEPDRIAWETRPATPDPNLSFKNGVVTVGQPPAGDAPLRLEVTARFQGQSSNAVTVTAATAKPTEKIALTLNADRTLLTVGDTGQVALAAANAQGAVPLAAEQAKYTSSKPAVLEIDPTTGAYRAVAAGEATVTAQHPAAGEGSTAELAFRVVEPAQARLEFRPAAIRLAVGTQQPVDLVLVTGDGREASVLQGPQAADVVIAIPDEHLEAVAWSPPNLEGRKPAAPFPLTATFQGKTATATVEVLEPPAQPAALRVNPESVTLAPLESVTPRVEQQLPGSDQWQEVRADAVQWTVPRDVHWTPPQADLRPLLIVPEGGAGPYELQAAFGGAQATLVVRVAGADKPLAVADPAVQLEVRREPPGERLPVGRSQRYFVVARQGERTEVVPDAVWQSDFSNASVRWEAPVLAALQAGHTQTLTARVGDREVQVTTTTVEPCPGPVAQGPCPPPPPSDTPPVRLTIGSRQGQQLTLPVGAQFEDFQVLAHPEQGPPRDVTRWADLTSAPAGADAPVALAPGRITTLRPGTAVVSAAFGGLTTAAGLQVTVAEDAKLDRLEVTPADVTVGVGETARFTVHGFAGETPLGDLSDCPSVTWKSRSPDLVQMSGPVATGLQAGRDAGVTAQVGSVVSNVATVQVVPRDAPLPDPLTIQPPSLLVESGQTVHLGSDVVARRGPRDVTDQCQVQAATPEIVRYDPATASLVAGQPGTAEVLFSHGDRSAPLRVVVQAAPPPPADVQVLIEPATSELAVGQSRDLRFFLVNPDGRRVERTGSAVFRTRETNIVAIDGNTVRGLAPGTAAVGARVAGLAAIARAEVTVRDVPVTDVVAAPARLELGTGETQRLEVTGVAAGGRRVLNGHPDLSFRIGGAQPDAVQLVAPDCVQGLHPGNATIDVSWRGQVVQQVPATVVETPITGLHVEPSQLDLQPGERRGLQAYVLRGTRRSPVGAEDGVALVTGDPAVAAPVGGLVLEGRVPGTTDATARWGPHTASATVVVRPPPPPGPPVRPVALRFARDVLRLAPGGGPVRVPVLEIRSDGSYADVSDQVTLSVADRPEVVEPAAFGATLTPRQPGNALVHASRGDMKTDQPLLVDVAAVEPAAWQLVAAPDPLAIREGAVGTFDRVAAVAADRGSVPVAFRLRSLDERVVQAAGDTGLRAVAPGRARVAVTAVAPGTPYDGLQTTALVDVYPKPPAGPEPAPGAPPPHLVLSGPTRTTAGQQVSYEVQLVRGNRAWPVTYDQTSLVLTTLRGPREGVPAEWLSGGLVQTHTWGTVSVRARHGGLTSNPVTLQIDPRASRFAALTLDLARPPLRVGETRRYRLWGQPAGGGPPQELTDLISPAPAPGRPVVRVEGAAVEHAPPTIVGQSEGTVELRASLDDLQSPPVTIAVVRDKAPPLQVFIDPPAVNLQVGQRTPVFRVTARYAGDPVATPVAAALRSLDPKVLAPDSQVPNRFQALVPGTTFVEGTYAGQTARAEVQVAGNPFLRVGLGQDYPDPSGTRFSVDLEIEGANPGGVVEYRILRDGGGIAAVGGAAEGGWTAATAAGERVQATLRSPVFSYGRAVYDVIIEARYTEAGPVHRYPYAFQMKPVERNQP